MNNPAVEVTFPSGQTKLVYPIRVLVQAQNAEFKAKYGVFLPGVAKQHPTIKGTIEEYEIEAMTGKRIRTWEQLGPVLRGFHADLNKALGL